MRSTALSASFNPDLGEPGSFLSVYGWFFCGLLVVVILTQIFAVTIAARRRKERRESGLGRARIGRGRILAMLGGAITAIGALLPWATYSNPAMAPVDSFTATFEFAGFAVLVFGLVGLEFVAIRTKGTATWGSFCGIVTLIVNLAAFGMVATFAMNEQAGQPGLQVSTGYGVYIGLIGSLALVVGSALAYLEAPPATSP